MQRRGLNPIEEEKIEENTGEIAENSVNSQGETPKPNEDGKEEVHVPNGGSDTRGGQGGQPTEQNAQVGAGKQNEHEPANQKPVDRGGKPHLESDRNGGRGISGLFDKEQYVTSPATEAKPATETKPNPPEPKEDSNPNKEETEDEKLVKNIKKRVDEINSTLHHPGKTVIVASRDELRSVLKDYVKKKLPHIGDAEIDLFLDNSPKNVKNFPSPT